MRGDQDRRIPVGKRLAEAIEMDDIRPAAPRQSAQYLATACEVAAVGVLPFEGEVGDLDSDAWMYSDSIALGRHRLRTQHDEIDEAAGLRELRASSVAKVHKPPTASVVINTRKLRAGAFNAPTPA